jgi:hypothetical protein
MGKGGSGFVTLLAVDSGTPNIQACFAMRGWTLLK